jgi:outer membrane protein assembly factor BamB
MRTLLTLAVLGLAMSPARAGETWPQFRGPGGTGHSDSTGLPTRWGEKLNVVWKTPIHDKGWSSPVVWGKQVWLTTARADGKQFFALCLDRDSGKVLHDIKLRDVAKPAFCHPFNSYASPTPAIEEGRIYVHFGTYGTFCLDTRTAKVLWSRTDLHCDHWRGPGSSPVLWGNLLFLTFDGYDRQYVVALDKASGRTVWKKDRNIDYGTDDGDLKKAYSTPSIVTVKGQPQLLSSAAVATIAYEPRTGKELWKVYHGGMNAASPPLVGHGLVYLLTGHQRGGQRVVAARLGGSGDVTKTHVAWWRNKEVPTRPAPLLVGELLYLVSDGGFVSCLEARTGEVVWTRRLGGAFTASPVSAEGRLYLFDQNGKGTVLQAGRKALVLAVNRLEEGCMASPAVAGQALFVRTKTHLYRIEKR